LALSDPLVHTPGAVVQAFDPGHVSLGSFHLNTAPPGAGQFSQGHFSYTGAPLSELQVDLAVNNTRFAIDDLIFDAAPAGGGGSPVPLPAGVWAGLALAGGLAAKCRVTRK
jgi:hypothetical protein